MAHDRYGDFNLKRGDFDLAARPHLGHGRYQGVDFPGPLDPGYVGRLQQDLRDLGFVLVGTVDGDFGLKTELALREFQAYARLNKVAQQVRSDPTYANQLDQADNPAVYGGAVSGELNADTAVSLVAWLNNQMRCPVVIEARRIRGGRYDIAEPPVQQNIWGALELTSAGPRVFAVDYSDQFDATAPADFRDANGRIVLGYASVARKGKGSKARLVGGPAHLVARHSIASAEILPSSLVDKPWSDLDEAEMSTFRVIRAVADLECEGTFDSLNAYDNAVMSAGPYHHILLLQSGRTSSSRVTGGELGGYLAYLQKTVPTSYARLLAARGVGFKPVVNGRVNWRRDTAGRVYNAMIKLQDTDGNFTKPVNTYAVSEHLRGWHWFYRFSSAARTDAGFRLGYWFMARLRLWDILSAEWDGRIMEDDRTMQSRPLLIGDVFRSEVAVAVLLRYHVSAPGVVLRSGKAGPLLRWALRKAGLDGKTTNPRVWSNDDEARLIDRLRDGIVNGIETTPGTRVPVKGLKQHTKGHAADLLYWPLSQKKLYTGRPPRSRLAAATDGDALLRLSPGREFGFLLHSPEWGTPPWE